MLGVLPAALLVALAAWQLVLAGQSAWLAARAAHSAARAQAVGKDPERAARSAIPSPLRRGLRVRAAPDGTVAVGFRFRSPLAGGPGRADLFAGAAGGKVNAASERGQASIELLGGAVAVLLAGFIGLQLLGAGYAAVMADHAAEAAALASLNGRSPEDAARSAVPGWPTIALDVQPPRRRGARSRCARRRRCVMLRRRLSFESSVDLPPPQGGG